MTIPAKVKVAMGVVLAVVLVAAGQYVSYLWKYAYSRGTRTGVVRKLSVKGPPYCKYLEGEMTLQGAQPGEEPWRFSIDDHSDLNPVMTSLHDNERNAVRVTIHYREDKPIWWRCNPSSYFAEKLEK
jgi:hypothetical protein